MDILILALIAGFLIYKLVQNLGQIDEADYDYVKATMKDVTAVDANANNHDPSLNIITEQIEVISLSTISKYPQLEEPMLQLHQMNKNFTETYFTEASRNFYHILKDAVLNDKIVELKEFLVSSSIFEEIKELKFLQPFVEIMCKIQIYNIIMLDKIVTIDIEISAQDMLVEESNKIVDYKLNLSFCNDFSKVNQSNEWLLSKVIVR